jgi:radical SAM superfamily enzyme YgiQ (UPF0313 family)
MNILLIYPQYPDTYWGFKHALKFISKKAVNPPLGLITVSAMLPNAWHKKLIDLNIESLKDEEIIWADYIFISAMNIQLNAAKELITRCKKKNKTVVCGGPLFTEEPDLFPEVDHFVLNEAEITLPVFLNDLLRGIPKRKYSTTEFADLEQTPMPDYSLVDADKYNTLNLQYTRGCPFNCEFCDITALLGHKVRAKSTKQIINELETIYQIGWRKNVFFVDDNFIGNKRVLKSDLLPAMIGWMQSKNYPFTFSTEASINLSDDEELMELMNKAGFSSIFIGIETPENESLSECGKTQNVNRNMVNSVHKIQNNGFEVNGGFILGFDNDSVGVFQKQIDFIRESGIITAMVGLLNAPKKTRLYKRLKDEGRIIHEITGSNTDFSLNFIPIMDKTKLMDGYKNVISGIYGGKEYYERVKDFVKRFNPNKRHKRAFTIKTLNAFVKSVFKLGLIDKYRRHYWGLFFWTLFNRPAMVNHAVTYSVYGYHFRKVFKEVL